MPGDRSNQAGPGRSLMPTLASNRAAKSPLTPKLATKANTISTPGSRPQVSSQDGGAARGASKDAQSTPVNALLINNVTPRSSSRKSRVDSSQTTPTSISGDTPNGGRAKSPIHGRIEGFTGLGITESPKLVGTRPRSQVSGLGNPPAVSTSRTQYTRGSSRPFSEVIDRHDSPNFFHADDVRPQHTAPRQPEPKKAPAFFYANSREEDQARDVDVPSPGVSMDDRPMVPSKFFHADGSADQIQTFPLLSPPMSTSSSRSSFISSPTQGAPPLLPTHTQPSQAWAASPPKENLHLSYRKGASQIMPSNAPQKSLTSLSATSTPALSNPSRFDTNVTSYRRSSAASSTAAKPRVHTKTTSMSSIDVTPRKSSSLQNSSPLSPSTVNSSDPISPSERAYATSKPTVALSPTSSTWPRSPTKSAPDGSQDSNDGNNSSLANMSELAAKARHDRKVLDLEISNSSLLTVNRSLEREIRKQKAELRRFRRLTRKSLIQNPSLASTARSTSYGSAGGESGTDGLSEGNEGTGAEGDYEEDDSDSEDYSEDSDDEVSEGKNEKDAKRLRLDLSKHREILVDSQKLNQSIKRCVGFTEELISQGRRALEYKVRVSDVKLGGRVLSEGEDEGDEDGLHEVLEDNVPDVNEEEHPATKGDSDSKTGDNETNDLLGAYSSEPNQRTVSFGSVMSDESNGIDTEVNGRSISKVAF